MADDTAKSGVQTGSGGWLGFLPARVDELSKRRIAWWLLVMCALIAVMVVVGGATRLTDSGLSITEWKPVTGIIPPLSEAAWAEEFTKYKTIPEYERINKGMSLAAFKRIYWWEWGHRFLGRMIGFAFFLPFVYFLVRRRIDRELAPRLVLMFVLGGAQGALGWFMVQSGLTERVDVSQYRLAAHLGVAFLIYAYILWVALELLLPRRSGGSALPQRWRTAGVVLAVLVYVQVVLGAFVAGLDAGFTFNTWPLMGERFVPYGYFFLDPWYANFFENTASVQFNHRMMGYLVGLVAGGMVIAARRAALPSRVRSALALVAVLVVAQIALGVWTLLAVVPISLGIAHQAGALLVFSATLVLVYVILRHPVRGSDRMAMPVSL